MSFKGRVEASCPEGCPSFQAEVWSFVRGDQDGHLRDQLLAGELNLLLCETCGVAFYPDVTIVYFDPSAELVAFVFPASYEEETERWTKKMAEDYEQMKGVLKDVVAGLEPACYFGMDAIRAALQEDDDIEDEVKVAEYYCRQLKLGIHPVDRSFARQRRVPRLVPLHGAKGFSHEAALKGIKTLLKANDRLQSFLRWEKRLALGETPPLPRGSRA